MDNGDAVVYQLIFAFAAITILAFFANFHPRQDYSDLMRCVDIEFSVKLYDKSRQKDHYIIVLQTYFF